MRIQDEPNLEQLRAKALVLLQENERLSKKVVELLRENLSLKGMTPAQLQQALLAIDEAVNKAKAEMPPRSPSTERRAPETSKKEKKPQTGHGPTAQPRLPVIQEVHDVEEADRQCVSCGGHLEHWKDQDDETEEVDVVERHFVLKKHVRKKYRCQCGTVEMAEMPPRLVPGGRYSNAFAIEVAIAKFLDHLPLERQVRIMGREGLVVESQTLWDQTAALATLFEVAWQELRADAICSRVLGFDETSWEVMTKGSASRKSWTMWQLSTRRVVYYAIAPARDTEEGNTFLEGFAGIAVGDAYIVHKSMAKASNYGLAFCWAHARRAFIKAEANDPIRAGEFIGMVQELYAVEEQAPPGHEGDDQRRALRNEKSRAITKRMETWLIEQRTLPGSDFGKAVRYVANNWKGLCVFLDDPEVPIDNNQTERGFRSPALGRNNFYGSHSRRGTEVAAIFYSLFESAKLNDLDPKAYLKTALAAALAGKRIPLPHEIA